MKKTNFLLLILSIIFIFSINIFAEDNFYNEEDKNCTSYQLTGTGTKIYSDTDNNLGNRNISVGDRYIYHEYLSRTITTEDTFSLSYTSILNRINIIITTDSDIYIHSNNLFEDTTSFTIWEKTSIPLQDTTIFFIKPIYTSAKISIKAEAIKP